MNQAIILAAGIGSRLSKYTHNVPKTLLPVKYGQTILERMLHQLNNNNIRDIVIVLGYQYDNSQSIINEFFKSFPKINIKIANNKNFKRTGTLKSLIIGMQELSCTNEDFLVIEGDVICDDYIISKINNKSGNIIVGDSGSVLDDEAMKYNFKESNLINNISKEIVITETAGEAVGIMRIDGLTAPIFLQNSLDVYNENNFAFYEEVINKCNINFKVLDVYPYKWTEIDFPEDYKKARKIFTEIEKLEVDFSLFEQTTHSPSIFSLVSDMDVEIQDFCFLANPYLLNDKFISEIHIELKQLLNSYPPFQQELAKRLSEFHSGKIHHDNIIVGNGATELIDILNYWSKGSIVPIPTFSEYIDSTNNLLTYQLKEENDYNLDIDNFIRYCNNHSADDYSNVIIINPNNPVGKTLNRGDMIKLIEKLNKFKVIVDESFLDFSYPQYSIMDLVSKYENLVVVKSFGKTLGMPGIRLGAIYSDDKFIEEIKKKVPFWNVNSIASFILNKISIDRFKKKLNESLKKVTGDTKQLYNALKKIPDVKVYHPTGNYVLIKILNDMTSVDLRNELLKERIFVRDCSNKIGLKSKKYVRIASRTKKENLSIARHIEMILADFESNL